VTQSQWSILEVKLSALKVPTFSQHATQVVLQGGDNTANEQKIKMRKVSRQASVIQMYSFTLHQLIKH
jgi:hypothetical protein